MSIDLHLHASLNTVATQALLFEQISTQLKNQAEALKRDGLDGPPVEDLLEARGLPPRVGHRRPDTRRGGATVGAESANTSNGDGAKLPLAPTSRLPHRHTYRDEGGGQDTHDAHSCRALALAYSTEEA